MPTVDSVQSPGTSLEIDPTFRAARVSIRPLEYQFSGKILGHYRVFGQTSAIAPTANVVLGAFRWTDSTNFAVIMRVFTTVTVVTAVTAQRNDPIVLVPVRSYTVRDLTNATALTMSGNNQKLRTTMSTSLVGNIDVASAAGGMTGGTGTADANAIGAAGFTSALVALGSGLATTELYKWDALGQHPVVLALNEGLRLNWGATTLATGTITVGFGIEWAEVQLF